MNTTVLCDSTDTDFKITVTWFFVFASIAFSIIACVDAYIRRRTQVRDLILEEEIEPPPDSSLSVGGNVFIGDGKGISKIPRPKKFSILDFEEKKQT